MKRTTPKWGRYILLVIILFFLGRALAPSTLTPPAQIVVSQGSTPQVFLQPLPLMQRVSLKRYMRTHPIDAKKLQIGTYLFSGTYTKSAYLDAIMAGPPKDYTRVTVLEGRSIFDIDAMLAKKGLTSAGAFVAAAQDPTRIEKLGKKYPFLMQETPLQTLEGFLYPDTYFLGNQGDPIEQLIQASLKRFQEKILSQREQEGVGFLSTVAKQGLQFSLPGALALASVIEKEERANAQKPTIAGVFLSRLSQGIQLGADITLCYGMKEPYETCTPSRIVAGIYDTQNPYNTRIQKGLPPTPISNVSDKTFAALLRFTATPYLFYLHDAKGDIHYATTNAEHEINKQKYLQ